MEGYPASTRAFLSAVALAIGYWGHRSPPVRRLWAYSAAILVMVYLCSIGGIFAIGRIPARWDVPTLGFVIGAALGVVAGIVLGGMAVNNVWLYWILVLAVAGVITWLPPLF